MTVYTKELVGRDLIGFEIVEMTEVYRVDDDGLRSSSIGFFRDQTIAAAFVETRREKSWIRTECALILTDGTVGYVIENQKPVKLFDDEAETLEIKKRAVARLSPLERKILGFE